MPNYLSRFSKRQLLTLAVFGIADFSNAVCVSLLAPFFPYEAELKGATALEYGLIFGIFELVRFIISPIYGQYLAIIGPERMFHTGILITGICSILFGFLDRIESHVMFIVAALVIRVIEAMGDAAFLTAGFAIIANEFPDNVGTTFAFLETFFGLGLIVGPTIGGILYSIGGYTMPFVSLGIVLFLTGIMTTYLLPKRNVNRTEDKSNTGRFLEVLRISGMPMCAFTIISTSISISFLTTTLEPHIRMYFDLTPVVLGLVFVVMGATYAFSATGWGWICDKYMHPKSIAIIGGIILICDISLIGPAPFIPLYPSLKLIILGLLLHGLGIGARLVSSFTDALQTAVASGYPNDLETYGLVSGLWNSSFALGAFIGPTVSGFLYDKYGFSNASLFLIILITVLIIFEYGSYTVTMKKASYYKGYLNLDNNDDHDNAFYTSSFLADKESSIYYHDHSAFTTANTSNHRNPCIAANNNVYRSKFLQNGEKMPILIETLA